MDDPGQKLDNLVLKARRTLLEINTVFPFDFFPDRVRIDENKVDIISYEFFFTKHLISILIKNINSATISTGVFFATLNLEVAGFVTGYNVKPYPIRYLWKRDAIRARRIILGLIAAEKEKIDLAKVSSKDLIFKIEEIGKTREFPMV
jgi:hypothetical protein